MKAEIKIPKGWKLVGKYRKIKDGDLWLSIHSGKMEWKLTKQAGGKAIDYPYIRKQ